MYLGHFSLREAPFSITPDTDFYFLHPGAQAALNTLLVALRSGEGFLTVVGELGCGKTVLCRQLLRLLQHECVTAYIPNPDMGPDDLLQALAGELHLAVPVAARRQQRLNALGACLLRHAQAGRRVLVCIDEAQAIPLRTVESLRLLSNLETEKRKLLQIVLFGQPDLEALLARPEIRQLRQRITFREYLGPMPAEQVAHYLAHRLACAAGAGAPPGVGFSAAAARALAQASGGVPRLINVLAHKCLLQVYGEGGHEVLPHHVQRAVADGSPQGALRRRHWWRALAGWAGTWKGRRR